MSGNFQILVDQKSVLKDCNKRSLLLVHYLLYLLITQHKLLLIALKASPAFFHNCKQKMCQEVSNVRKITEHFYGEPRNCFFV